MEDVDTEQIRKAGLTFFFTRDDNSDIARRVEFDGCIHSPDCRA